MNIKIIQNTNTKILETVYTEFQKNNKVMFTQSDTATIQTPTGQEIMTTIVIYYE